MRPFVSLRDRGRAPRDSGWWLDNREAAAFRPGFRTRGLGRGVLAPPRRPGRRSLVDGRAVRQGAESVSRRGQSALLRAPESRSSVNVAVFGASGVIGAAVLPLLTREHHVVGVSRTAQPQRSGVQWLQGDVSSPTDVARAVDGVEAVYYLVHSLARTTSSARIGKPPRTSREPASGPA